MGLVARLRKVTELPRSRAAMGCIPTDLSTSTKENMKKGSSKTANPAYSIPKTP